MKQRAVLALESGGTKLVSGIADSDGRILHSMRMPRNSRNDASKTLADLLHLSHQLLQEVQGKYEIVACGFGFGGSVARGTQRAYLCLHEVGWDQLDARLILHAGLGIPIFIENDCKVAALAEATCGAGQNVGTVFYITVGTGIGGGFVRDRRIDAMHDNGECEIGHLPLEINGPVCGCGNLGCLEALASGPGILHSSNGSYSSTESIFAACERRDSNAMLLVERAANYIARGIACAMALYHPECVVLGGGVATGNPSFVRRITELASGFTVTYFRNDLKVRTAALGEQVVIKGAALYALGRMAQIVEVQ